VWWWEPRPQATRRRWCRVYHQSKHAPDGADGCGPRARLDHHHVADPSAVDASGRRILYVGEDLATSASEVFGESGNARLCPRYRVSILALTRRLAMFDLARKGSALAIGARPSLADGSEPRPLTQQWARAAAGAFVAEVLDIPASTLRLGVDRILLRIKAIAAVGLFLGADSRVREVQRPHVFYLHVSPFGRGGNGRIRLPPDSTPVSKPTLAI
jgi:RES domain